MPRNRIFIKIYLWFWLSTVVFMVTMISIDRLTQMGPPGENEFRQTMGKALSIYGQTCAEILENKNTASLKEFVGRLEESEGIRIFFYDNIGYEVTGRKGPEEFNNLGVLSVKSKGSVFVHAREGGFVVEKILSPSGNQYFIVGRIPRPLPGNPPFPPSSMLFRLFVEILMSGVVCYLLSIYLTSPIIKLGNAVRQFARGNLSVRVRRAMGKREDEISELASDFDRMADRIESLITSQQNLLRDISHELRSPLARLHVALELCRHQYGSEGEKSFDRIAREADKLNFLIGQILTLNRFESSTSAQEKTHINLTGLIYEIVDDSNFEAKSMNRTVTITGSDSCTVIGNEEQLRRAVENVIRNAVHYTPDGSVVDVKFGNRVIDDNRFVFINVRDYGPGVPEEALENLFKPFYRVGNDTRTNGAGLGLAITETAIRLHGGTVKVMNAADGGLCIEMTIPSG
jgi:two-component system, OmpR family, sensor histidine kinase CpxA